MDVDVNTLVVWKDRQPEMSLCLDFDFVHACLKDLKEIIMTGHSLYYVPSLTEQNETKNKIFSAL